MILAQPDILGPTGYATTLARPIQAGASDALPAQSMKARGGITGSMTERRTGIHGRRLQSLPSYAAGYAGLSTSS